jgi:hypothetical protein
VYALLLSATSVFSLAVGFGLETFSDTDRNAEIGSTVVQAYLQ